MQSTQSRVCRAEYAEQSMQSRVCRAEYAEQSMQSRVFPDPTPQREREGGNKTRGGTDTDSTHFLVLP